MKHLAPPPSLSLSRSLGVGAALFAVACLGLALSSTSCSSSSGSAAIAGVGCQTDPTQCPGEQTCWPTSATTFGCIPSNPSAGLGDSCLEEYNKATCADGYLCDATGATGTGQCAQYCSATAHCPSGYTCRTTEVGSGGLTVDICRIAPPATMTPTEDASAGETYEGGDLPDIAFAIPDSSVDGGPAQQ